MVPPGASGPVVLAVSELVAEVKGLLAGAWPEVWVRGEIAGLKVAGAGHTYFALKDEQLQISGGRTTLGGGEVRILPTSVPLGGGTPWRREWGIGNRE